MFHVKASINCNAKPINKFICFFQCYLYTDIEAQIADLQTKKKELQSQGNDKGVGLLESGYFDRELYDENTAKRNRYDGYMTSIAANDDLDEDDDDGLPIQKTRSYTAPKSILKDVIQQVNVKIYRFFT